MDAMKHYVAHHIPALQQQVDSLHHKQVRAGACCSCLPVVWPFQEHEPPSSICTSHSALTHAAYSRPDSAWHTCRTWACKHSGTSRSRWRR